MLTSAKLEETNSLEQNPELPMEIENVKMAEKKTEATITNEDTNKQCVKTETDKESDNKFVKTKTDKESDIMFVKTETDKESENMLPASKTIQGQVVIPPEVGQSVELSQNCQDDKSAKEEKVPLSKDNMVPSSQNQSITCEYDKPAASGVNKQSENEDDNIAQTCEDTSSFVRIAEDGIGALSLLMDYESPVSSPVSSPVRETLCDEITPGRSE